MSDFSWIDDIPVGLPRKWIIHNDLGDDHRVELEEWLYAMGFRWQHGTIEDYLIYSTNFYFNINTEEDFFDGYKVWNEYLVDMINNGYQLLRWSEIKF